MTADLSARAWPERLHSLQAALLGWYAEHQRPLPWRQTRDPYAILVSEIMLQQTQVERVIPKYRQFLDRFPTIEALAAAPRGDVIRLWAPLGYNRRAVRLHEAARLVVERHAGRLPSRSAELLALAGLGPYTAAAVACFAFDEQLPTLDTNVRRVLTRLFADRLPHLPPPRAVQAAAAEALPLGRASDWNQALMDLGATICLARAPACHRCPVADDCASRCTATATERPALRRAAESRVAYRAEPPFAGSTRFYRGRIVDRLRAVPPGVTVSLDEVGSSIRDAFSPEQRPWLLDLLSALAADGLLRLEPDSSGHHSSDTLRVSLA